MVLTDRQRADLHAGIYEYICSRPEWQPVAAALRQVQPDLAERYSSNNTNNSTSNGTASTTNSSSTIPLLEKKWTAIPRLQKRVLELEKQVTQSVAMHAHRGDTTSRLLPRMPPTHILAGHSMVITCCALHPKYTVAVSGSEDGTIKVWDHESGDYIRTLKGHVNTVNAVHFVPTGTHLISCSTDLSIKIWDFATYTCLRTLRGHDHTISAIGCIPLPSRTNETTSSSSNNNNTITTTEGLDAAGAHFLLSASRDTTVKLWDLRTGFCEHTWQPGHDWLRCLAVRGSLWATAGNDTVIYVYDNREQRLELRGHEHVVESIAMWTDECGGSATTTQAARDYLVSGSRDRSVRLWNLADGGTCLATFVAHENWVRGVRLHPSGLYILSCADDKTIRVFDIKNQRCLRTLENAHSHFVTCLEMHPTMPILITGSVDQTLRCWQLQ